MGERPEASVSSGQGRPAAHREAGATGGRGGPARQAAVPTLPLAGSLPRSARRDLRTVADASPADRPRQAAVWASRMLDAGLRPSSSVLEPAGAGYQQHLIFTDPVIELSVEWLAWHGGSATPIHGHRCWCVVAVAEGSEGEIRYEQDARSAGKLVAVGQRTWSAGDTYVRLPPDDIHQVFNPNDGLTVSLHVYGVNIARVGTSIDVIYDPQDVTLP